MNSDIESETSNVDTDYESDQTSNNPTVKYTYVYKFLKPKMTSRVIQDEVDIENDRFGESNISSHVNVFMLEDKNEKFYYGSRFKCTIYNEKGFEIVEIIRNPKERDLYGY